MESEIFEHAWTRQRISSQTLTQLRQRIDRARRAALGLAIATAVLAVAAGQVKASLPDTARVLGFIAAITAGWGGLIARQTELDKVEIWARARSFSEGIKSEVYQCLAGASAYAGVDADAQLFKRVCEIEAEAYPAEQETLGLVSDGKPIPEVHDVESYIAARVTDQIECFYRPKATLYKQRVGMLTRASGGLAALAVVLSALSSAYGWGGAAAWVPVVTTITTALAAYISASRYEEQIVDYLSTARQLEKLRLSRLTKERSDAPFIDACEALMAAENKAWQAGWSDR
ncbi:MAG: DUF4231 domain-containing protein [Cyanobium sp.]